MSALVLARREIGASAGLWLALAAGFFIAFELFQLALLVLRFQTFPNYLTAYDWPGNIARIVRMTPSVVDMVSIALDEWLIEIGSMDFAYGHGIAEWSFVLVPAMLYILGMGANVVVGTSLFQILFVTMATTMMHALTTHAVDIVLAVLLLFGSVSGAQLGTLFAMKASPARLRLILALIVLAVGARMALGLTYHPDEIFTVSPL